MIRQLSGDQTLTFQTHALQIVLFGSFTYESTIMCGSLQIVSLQLAPSVGKACALAWTVGRTPVNPGPAKTPPLHLAA